MKKSELVLEINNLISNHKLNKAFKSDMDSLLNEYLSSKSSKDEIQQIIEKDGVEYAWCNKHLKYEIASNFKKGQKGRKYHTLCNAAEAQFFEFSKEIKELDNELLSGEIDGDRALEILSNKKELIEIRKGSYDYGEIPLGLANYDYDAESISLEDAAAL